jgi:hypothetical protein
MEGHCDIKCYGKQGCGSGFSDFVDPDPYWESRSGSRGKKIKKFQWEKCTFNIFLKKIYH